jgi:peptidoglycan hydrolase-like protein with peptidoglycan-binding domain
MAEQSSAKTTGKTSAAKRESVTTATPATTGEAAKAAEISLERRPPEPLEVKPPKPLPDASPRNGVRVNVSSIERAFHTAGRSRSVVAIQYALKDRGFDPGTPTGLVDSKTRAAYAEYQRSIDERPTGVPTSTSLEHLGFEVVG